MKSSTAKTTWTPVYPWPLMVKHGLVPSMDDYGLTWFTRDSRNSMWFYHALSEWGTPNSTGWSSTSSTSKALWKILQAIAGEPQVLRTGETDYTWLTANGDMRKWFRSLHPSSYFRWLQKHVKSQFLRIKPGSPGQAFKLLRPPKLCGRLSSRFFTRRSLCEGWIQMGLGSATLPFPPAGISHVQQTQPDSGDHVYYMWKMTKTYSSTRPFLYILMHFGFSCEITGVAASHVP